jgi:hypothetical protein
MSNLTIVIDNEIGNWGSSKIENLADLVERECTVKVVRKRANRLPGDKDPGLIIALTIANVALTAIGTMISVLAFWKSQEPECSVSVSCGNRTYTVDKLTPDELKKMVATIEQCTDVQEIGVKVSRK